MAIVGSKWKMTQFEIEDVLAVPKLSKALDSCMSEFDRLHGQSDFCFMYGGCTLGNTSLLVPLNFAVAEKLPGCKQEDIAVTLLAERRGDRWCVYEDCLTTNRAGRDDLETYELGATRQALRWLRGIERLSKDFGEDAQKIIDLSKLDFSENLSVLTKIAHEFPDLPLGNPRTSTSW